MTNGTLIDIALALLGALVGYRWGVAVAGRRSRRDQASGLALESWRRGHEAGLRNAGIVHRHNRYDP
jgi:hypothetical protein